MKTFIKFCLVIYLSGFMTNAVAKMTYAVQKSGLNDSIFFSIYSKTSNIKPLPESKPPNFDHIIEEPDTEQLIDTSELAVSFIEGVSPKRIEEIIAAENATVDFYLPTLNSFHLKIKSDKTLKLLVDIVANFETYSEIEYVDIAAQATFG